MVTESRSHHINLIVIAGQNYIVDVGFGGKHPNLPSVKTTSNPASLSKQPLAQLAPYL
jgi:arylamine N-acetyltransferase